MAGNSISVLANMQMRGVLTLDNDTGTFPSNPKLGAMVVKGMVLYCFMEIGGLRTWYPLTQTAQSYVHTQAVAALTWEVVHNMGSALVWYTVQDPTGNPIYCERENIDGNSFRLTFTEPTVGNCLVVAPETLSVPSIQASLLTAASANIGGGAVLITTDGISVKGSQVLTEADLENGKVYVTPTQLSAAIAAVVGGAPANMDTLGEIATRVSAAETSLSGLTGLPATVTSHGQAITALQNAVVTIPYDIGFSVFAKPTASEAVFRFRACRAFKIPAVQTNGQARAGVAATGACTFVVAKNGAQVGTVAFAAAGNVGTISIASDVSVAVGDLISVTAPATVDGTLADIDFSLVAALV